MTLTQAMFIKNKCGDLHEDFEGEDALQLTRSYWQ